MSDALTNRARRPVSERWRIGLSQMIAWPTALLLIFTSSAWERFPLVGGCLFVAGCALVGLATIGRLWRLLFICGRKN